MAERNNNADELAVVVVDGTSSHHTTTTTSQRTTVPPTRCALPFIFLLLGVGVLVPWNAFISAKQYFQSRLCVQHDSTTTAATTNTYTSSIAANLESVFAVLYNLASVLSLGAVIAIQALRDQSVAAAAADVHVPSATSADNDNDDDYDDTVTTNERHQISILEGEQQNGTTPEAQRSHSSHTFWLVMAPLSIYLTAFLGQSFMVLIVHIPRFELWTIISLVVCGMCSMIAQSGIVATAGLCTWLV